MGAKCLFKYSAFAAGAQIGLLALGVAVRFNPISPYLYAPWEWLGNQLLGSGDAGGHALAGAATLGVLVGFVAYSLLAGVVICRLKARRRVP